MATRIAEVDQGVVYASLKHRNRLREAGAVELDEFLGEGIKAVFSRLTLKIALRSSATSLAGTWEITLRSKCTTHLCHPTPAARREPPP